ncbi:MAG: radical SAM family heme chaperone HemW [Xanthomonadales bacterium]|nr:radical SAM family heme chaperone HemW [Xanthomonadales bacterium]
MNTAPDTDSGLSLPPLSLYVHLPWCVRKCPYCDFNSHAASGDLPREAYVDALLKDLEKDLPLVWGRPVHSIFFGGGTPSLFSARQVERMLSGFCALLPVSPDVEISLEANPGTTEHDSFEAYRSAGVNRVSLGVQSFDDRLLAKIGRIHGRLEIDRAVAAIRRAGIANFNIDLMFALPGQSLESALEDLREAVRCEPAHISHYQLTLEPNTAFHVDPPALPDDDLAWEMQRQGAEILVEAGFEQYEISAWARPGRRCRHNLNYWQYGDFIGIGAGAHGKITLPSEGTVLRRIRQRHPQSWLRAAVAGDAIVHEQSSAVPERIFEFFLNQLRLREGVRKDQLSARTGAGWADVEARVRLAMGRGLLDDIDGRLRPTELGWRFANDLQAIFLP